MIWLGLACAAVVFFYLVGKYSTPQKPKQATKEGVVKDQNNKTHYPPGFDEPFENSYTFKLFDTEAVMAWNSGEEEVAIWCASSYSNGKRQTSVNRTFRYNYKENYWLTGEPRGAIKEIKAEILRALKK